MEWVEKNMDKLPDDVYRTLSASTDLIFLQPTFVALQETAKGGSSSSYIASGFKKKLQVLEKDLSACQTTFVRCLKTNKQKIPCRFEDDLVLSQLAYTGMLATLNIRRQGYPLRLPKREFLKKYAYMLPGDHKDINSSKALSTLVYHINQMVPELARGAPGTVEPYLLEEPLLEGKTMVLGREWLVLELAERRRNMRDTGSADIQSTLRAVAARKDFSSKLQLVHAWGKVAEEIKHFLKRAGQARAADLLTSGKALQASTALAKATEAQKKAQAVKVSADKAAAAQASSAAAAAAASAAAATKAQAKKEAEEKKRQEEDEFAIQAEANPSLMKPQDSLDINTMLPAGHTEGGKQDSALRQSLYEAGKGDNRNAQQIQAIGLYEQNLDNHNKVQLPNEQNAPTSLLLRGVPEDLQNALYRACQQGDVSAVKHQLDNAVWQGRRLPVRAVLEAICGLHLDVVNHLLLCNVDPTEEGSCEPPAESLPRQMHARFLTDTTPYQLCAQIARHSRGIELKKAKHLLKWLRQGSKCRMDYFIVDGIWGLLQHKGSFDGLNMNYESLWGTMDDIKRYHDPREDFKSSSDSPRASSMVGVQMGSLASSAHRFDPAILQFSNYEMKSVCFHCSKLLDLWLIRKNVILF